MSAEKPWEATVAKGARLYALTPPQVALLRDLMAGPLIAATFTGGPAVTLRESTARAIGNPIPQWHETVTVAEPIPEPPAPLPEERRTETYRRFTTHWMRVTG